MDVKPWSEVEEVEGQPVEPQPEQGPVAEVEGCHWHAAPSSLSSGNGREAVELCEGCAPL